MRRYKVDKDEELILDSSWSTKQAKGMYHVKSTDL
jgi:hypothetical protein